jgi:hypothetical protein
LTVVSDTSPIIALQRIGFLDLLPGLYGEIWIPPGVRDELERDGRMQVADHPFLRIVASPSLAEVQPKLHRGEREAVALAASQPGCLLLMDERDGRRFAATMSIDVVGTGGLLVDAKRAGLISAVRPVLESLAASGFRIGVATRDALLQLAGE